MTIAIIGGTGLTQLDAFLTNDAALDIDFTVSVGAATDSDSGASPSKTLSIGGFAGATDAEVNLSRGGGSYAVWTVTIAEVAP